MGTPFLIIGMLFAHVCGRSSVDKEFNRNIFEDDVEYTLIDPNFSQELQENNQYFRQVRAFEEDYKNFEMVDRTESYYVPTHPFQSTYERLSFNPTGNNYMNDDNARRSSDELYPKRIRRNAKDDEDNLQVAVEIERDIEKHLGKPIEIAVLELENATEAINQSDVFRKGKESRSRPENNLVIDDFIRFKREVAQLNDTNYEDKPRPKREKEVSKDGQGKMFVGEADTSREPRGAIKEQWVKQPYPVRSANSETYEEDSATSNTETLRAPRVHFITQRRSESSPEPVYRSFDRINRGRDLSKDLPYDSPREFDRLYHQRPPRHYESYPPPPYRRNYYRNDRPTSNEGVNKFQEVERPVYNKQRRIIYYATLPEVVRTPPNVDLRDRYNYRDRYDSRFVSSPPLAVAGADPYRYRKPYPPSKSGYDEIERSKRPYSLKVSTDLNVREIKKNPERRIYSEGDRRYVYGGVPPYRLDEVPYGRRP